MGELILHIGTTKTGSTSLQVFLSSNREKLAEHGVAYPPFAERSWPHLHKNGNFFTWYSVALARNEEPPLAPSHVEETLRTLSSSFASGQRTLISDENLFSAASWLLSSGHPYERYWPTLANVLEEAGMQKATIVIYLRRQDDWASSSWRQLVKTGNTELPFEGHCMRPSIRLRMDYAHMLSLIEDAFHGKARIIVRPYDRKRLEGGDIVRDFCSACDIPWDDAYKPLKKDLNHSISFDVAEGLRVFEKDAPSLTDMRRDALIPLASRLSRNNPDPPGTTPFDEEAMRALLEPYLEGNSLIEERYLGGEPLFSYEYNGQHVWTPDEERVAEYRAVFEKAIAEYKERTLVTAAVHGLARRLPENVKRPLRAVRRRLFGR